MGKVTQVCLALAMPTSVILAYYLYRQWSSSDEEVYGMNRIVTSRNTVIEVSVPHKAVGTVIGRQGAMIKQIKKETGARIHFKDRQDPGVAGIEEEGRESRTAIIYGTAESAQQAELMIHQIIAEMPEILTEEVEIPTYSVGRIIGKGGTNIREMCRVSEARINIDRAQDTKGPDTLTTVTLSGSRHQIDVALELIDERLVLEEEFRTMSTVKTSESIHRNQTKVKKEPLKATPVVVPNASWDELANDTVIKQDGLPLKDGYMELYVSAVEHPGHFWVQVVSTRAMYLEQLQADITTFAMSEEAREKYCVTEVISGQLVAARYENTDNTYYRAKIIDETPDGQIDLYFVDFGDNSFADKSEVFLLRQDFLGFPFQAVECCLAGVIPRSSEWSEDAIILFEELAYCAQWKVIFGKVTSQGQDSNSPSLQLIDTSAGKDVDIARELVNRGLATTTDRLASNAQS